MDVLRGLALSDAAFFGVAAPAPAGKAIAEQGAGLVDGYPRAMAIGIRMADSIVDLLPAGTRSRRPPVISTIAMR